MIWQSNKADQFLRSGQFMCRPHSGSHLKLSRSKGSLLSPFHQPWNENSSLLNLPYITVSCGGLLNIKYNISLQSHFPHILCFWSSLVCGRIVSSIVYSHPSTFCELNSVVYLTTYFETWIYHLGIWAKISILDPGCWHSIYVAYHSAWVKVPAPLPYSSFLLMHTQEAAGDRARGWILASHMAEGDWVPGS